MVVKHEYPTSKSIQMSNIAFHVDFSLMIRASFSFFSQTIDVEFFFYVNMISSSSFKASFSSF
jgi:hypothetical protein